MNPFQEHAANVADYQAMLKGDDQSGGAQLIFYGLSQPVTVDCRFEKIMDDFDIGGGQIPKLVVPACRFLAADIPPADQAKIRKSLWCDLLPNPQATPVTVKLWAGGLLQGGLEFEFMLVDRNYLA